MATVPKIVYVVVSEEFYGGSTKNIRVFANEEVAQIYAETVGTQTNLDMRILKAEISEVPADIQKMPVDVTPAPEAQPEDD